MEKVRITEAALPLALAIGLCCAGAAGAEGFQRPYVAPCVERQDVFEFTQKPAVKLVGKDRYEITFAVKGFCDVAAAIVDEKGTVVRHLGAGVLGSNAPAPFQKDSLSQKIFWNGKDDLDVYHKHPEKLEVRVMLGLEPKFDKTLGYAHPKHLPGRVWCLAASPEGVYVFTKGYAMGRGALFNHDTNYVRTILPHPANVPDEKLGGRVFIEYEPGRRSTFGPDSVPSFHLGFLLPRGIDGGATTVDHFKPAVAGGRIFFCNNGQGGGESGYKGGTHLLHYIYTDGCSDVKGMTGRLWHKDRSKSCWANLAVSPDGKWLYYLKPNWGHGRSGWHALARASTDGDEQVAVLVGEKGKPGSDDAHFNQPTDLTCDPGGRIYVTDSLNNRVQVFTGDGKYLKTLKVERPRLIEAHRKTGEIYVAHTGRIRGKSVSRLTRFRAYPDLTEAAHWDGTEIALMALDSWSSKPRLWTACAGRGRRGVRDNVVVYEDRGGQLKKLADFDEEVRRLEGKNTGNVGGRLACDPTREHLVIRAMHVFDLETGKYLGEIPGTGTGGAAGAFTRLRGSPTCDVAFDKYGYMHCNIVMSLDPPLSSGIGRLDLSRTEDHGRSGGEKISFPAEVPYDYGVETKGWAGAIKLYRSDHHHWTWGMGVDMRGDIAVIRDIEFVPALMTESFGRWRGEIGGRPMSYEAYVKMIQEDQKRGEQYFKIPRRPGSNFHGGTVFTFDRTGEVRDEAAVVTGGGADTLSVQIDEDGKLYFINRAARAIDGKPFLAGRAGIHGTDRRFTPTTGTYVKSQRKDALFQREKARVALDTMPDRPADMFAVPNVGGVSGSRVWVKGAEWMYAGASPHPIGDCQCPQLRAHLDWYKRSYVPETYRRSIGILDANGNFIMRVGRYGNYDSQLGPKSGMPVEGGIASTFIRFISGTDNYLVYTGQSTACTVLRLGYHAEHTIPIEE